MVELNTASSRFRRLLRRLYRWFWYGLGFVIILIAIFVSIIRMLLPDAGSYRSDFEALASQALGQTVEIESISARLDGITPSFVFKDVHLFDQNKQRELIRFDKVYFSLDLLKSIRHARITPKTLVVSGVSLGIRRDKSGRLSVQGLSMEALETTFAFKPESDVAAQSELGEWFLERTKLAIENSTVLWRDDLHEGKTVRFDNVNFLLRNHVQHHQLTGRVTLPSELGDDLELDLDFAGNIFVPSEWQGRFYLRGMRVQTSRWGIKPQFLGNVVEEGEIDFQVWGTWTPKGFADLAGHLTARAVSVTTTDKASPFKIKLLAGIFDWRRANHGWQLRIGDFRYQRTAGVWPPTAITVVQDNSATDTSRLTVHSSLLNISDVSALLQESGRLDKTLQAQLAQMAPQGEVFDLFIQSRLAGNLNEDLVISGRFKDLVTHPVNELPGLRGIDGELWADSTRGQVTLSSRHAIMTLPKLFREPFTLNRLDSAARWWHVDGDMHIDLYKLIAGTDRLETDSRMYMVVPDRKRAPFMDLHVRFSSDDAKSAWRFYPTAIMDNELVNWLDQAIVAGRVREGQAILYGRLDAFPFSNGTDGVFAVDFHADDLELKYQAGWPNLQAMKLAARFSGTGMALRASEARLFEGQLHDLKANIADFNRPLLSVHGLFNGATRDVVRFLAQTPIAPEADEFYRHSEFQGRSSASVNLSIPLNAAVETQHPLRYHGKVTFHNSAISSWEKMLQAEQLNGELNYSEQGVFADKLRARVFGGETQLHVFTHTYQNSQQIRIGLRGELDFNQAWQHFKMPGADKVTGRAAWQGLLSFGHVVDAMDVPGSFSFVADTAGVGLDLPKPFSKSAAEAGQLYFQFQFPRDDTFTVTLSMDTRLRAAAVFSTDQRDQVKLQKATINFSNDSPVLPPAASIRIGGSLAGLVPADWRKIMSAASASGDFSSLNLPIVLDMDHLSIVTSDDESNQAAGKPSESPLLNGVIRQLIVDAMQLGELQIDTAREPDGIRIRRLSLSSQDMQLAGSGSWLYRNDAHMTNMIFELTSADVGNMLERLGYSNVVRHGRARAVWQASWADAPARFDFAILHGELTVVIDEGNISVIDPGAGRLLGLLSLVELPRHLTLNFKEFKSGFSFNQIKGKFAIEAGDAVTQDLNIDSPVAVIALRGRTGLASRDYDLNVIAVPRATGSLPIIAYLLSGGQAAGVAWIFERLLGDKIDDSIAKRYKVTGSWESPQVVEVEQPGKADASLSNTD